MALLRHPRAALLLRGLHQLCIKHQSLKHQEMLGGSTDLEQRFQAQLHPAAEGALGEEEEHRKPWEGWRQAGVGRATAGSFAASGRDHLNSVKE